jgi:hypothetical protein
MRFFTVALLAVTAILVATPAARAEEPELVAGYNVPETTVVPVSFSIPSGGVVVVAPDAEKSSSAKLSNSVLHIDENNRLLGLSN